MKPWCVRSSNTLEPQSGAYTVKPGKPLFCNGLAGITMLPDSARGLSSLISTVTENVRQR